MTSLQKEYRKKYFMKFSDIFFKYKKCYLNYNNLSGVENTVIIKIFASHLDVCESTIRKQLCGKTKIWKEGDRVSVLSDKKLLNIISLPGININSKEIADLIFFSEALKSSDIILQHIQKLDKRIRYAENARIRLGNVKAFVDESILENLFYFFKGRRDAEWFNAALNISKTIKDSLSIAKITKDGDEYEFSTIGNER